MWLPCIPNIPRSEYFYDSVSQDCLPKDKLPVGCLSWNDVPGANDCWDNCRNMRINGKPLSPSCYRRFVLHNCSEDTSLIADTFIYNESSGACIKRDGSQGCYTSPFYLREKTDCDFVCSSVLDPVCPPMMESTTCHTDNKAVQYFYNTLSGQCEYLGNLCLAGPNRFETLTTCLETCLQRTS
ncbi:uncharacterized protein LOC115323034 [Ixodes scapularis]|uniref:uncharacterized protein LOC115323034 n=1 Tax=Ixodes scapularis TaxID=6945 RepID=UPI0011619D30|nr:uncharacterized protein LOC115323034 [Ixodes scapularis]